MATYVAGKSISVEGSDDPVADLRAGWRLHVEFGLANPELYALLNTPGRGAPSPATAAGIEVLRTRCGGSPPRACCGSTSGGPWP